MYPAQRKGRVLGSAKGTGEGQVTEGDCPRVPVGSLKPKLLRLKRPLFGGSGSFPKIGLWVTLGDPQVVLLPLNSGILPGGVGMLQTESGSAVSKAISLPTGLSFWPHF